MVSENLQMNLKFVQSASDATSSAQQPIIKKEPMDVSTTDVVKEGPVLGNSSNNVNLGELSNPASNLVADAVVPSLTLDSLSSVVEEAEIPTEEESTQYLQQVANLKKVNAEHVLLNVIDEIIDMTVCGKIGNNIGTDIPDSIIASIHKDNFVAEYIHSSVTKKWVEHRFQQDAERYSVDIKSKTGASY